MTVSQTKIAKLVGVSRSAVSHVLNGREYMVSAEVHKRIMEVVREQDYHRNVLVRGLQTKSTQVFGLIITDVGVSYFSKLVTAIEAAGKAKQYQCFLCQSHSSVPALEKEIATLREYRVDGLIVMPTNSFERPDVFQRLIDHKVPVVLLDMEVAGVSASYAGNDNVAIGRLATQHLLELGHRRIACIKGYTEQLNLRERVEGYEQAMREAGLKLDKRLIVGGTRSATGGEEAVQELISKQVEFTALVTSSDFSAIGAIRELQRQGRRVPADVSVVGCANLSMGEWVTPRLTTVDQNPQDVAQAAFDLLYEQIQKRGSRARKIWVKPSLVLRDSTTRLT